MRPRRRAGGRVSSDEGERLVAPTARRIGGVTIPRPLRWLAAVLAWIVGDALGVRRRHAETAMRVAGIEDPPATARAMYRHLATGLVELLWLAARREVDLRSRVRLDPRVRELLAEGRGLVVATAHTGSWDLVACAAASEAPLTIVTKRLSVRWLDRLWQGIRAARGVRLVEAGRAAAEGQRALARGAAVAMLVDQAPERHRGVTAAPFLGRPARVDLAPALLAMRARAPLVAAFGRRGADGTHVVEILDVLRPPARPSRAWAVEAMQRVTALLDAFVRAHPEQWLWMHRRWKDAPPLPSCSRGAPGLSGSP